jgi:hypothetical protein
MTRSARKPSTESGAHIDREDEFVHAGNHAAADPLTTRTTRTRMATTSG